jgi:flagellar motor switch protein FliG
LAKKEYIKSAEQLDKERREKIKDHIFLFNLLVKKLILASFLFYMFMN